MHFCIYLPYVLHWNGNFGTALVQSRTSSGQFPRTAPQP